MHLLIVAVVICIVASVLLYAVKTAPEPAVNAEFKGWLRWLIFIGAALMLITQVLIPFLHGVA